MTPLLTTAKKKEDEGRNYYFILNSIIGFYGAEL